MDLGRSLLKYAKINGSYIFPYFFSVRPQNGAATSMEESADVSGAASTGEVLCYRQRVEKSTGGEITLMQWSPTMDLLAAAFADNSVS